MAAAVVFVASGCSRAPAAPEGDVIIETKALVTLGDENGPGGFSSYPIPSRPTGDGNYVVADEGTSGPVPIFDANGKFVRTIGGSGEGPGEFRRISRVLLLPGDSIVVLDGALRRASVFSPGYEYVRSFGLPVSPFEVVGMGGDAFVAVGGDIVPQVPFVRFNTTGVASDSFGPMTVPSEPQLPHRLASGTGKSFWSAQWQRDYLIEAWDSLGNQTRELRPGSDWAVTNNQMTRVSPTVAPQWAVQGFWLDPATGHLVVLALVADVKWAEGLGPPRKGEGGTESYPIVDRDKVYDAIVEVIDSTTGKVLGSRRFNEAYRMVPFPGTIGRVVQSEEGIVRVELTAVTIRAGR